MDLQPKLSLRRQLMGLSPKYNDLGLGRDMAWYACPYALMIDIEDIYFVSNTYNNVT